MQSKLISGMPATNEVEYPCLMVSKTSGTVVLFTSKSTGTTLVEGSWGATSFGITHSNWEITAFTPIPLPCTIEFSK